MEAPDFTIKPQSLTKTARTINFFLRWIIPFVLWVKGADVKIANKKVVPKKGAVILVGADHTSLADAIFMIAAYRRAYAGIGMAELLSDEWPWIIRRGFQLLGHIPIERGNSESGDLVSQSARHALSYGQALAIWAQGRQIRPGEQAMWYPGFARFAMESGASIILFKIEGAHEFWPSHPDDGNASLGDINWKAPVRAAFSEPINPSDYNTIDELIAATKRIHAELPLPS